MQKIVTMSGHGMSEDSEGRVICACGATSARFGTDARRYEWARGHIAEAVAGEADRAVTPPPTAHPALREQLDAIRGRLQDMLGDLYAGADLPAPNRIEGQGAPLPGAWWDTGVVIRREDGPVAVGVLTDVVPGRPIVTLAGVGCSLPGDVTSITSMEARVIGNACIAAANQAEGIGR